MIDSQTILDKLKLHDLRDIKNILNNEHLCSRIIQEDPISVRAFLEKKIISSYTLKKLINGRLISCFSNTETNVSPKFIFTNEIAPYLDTRLVYNRSALNSIRDAGKFVLSIFKEILTEQEYDIMKIYLLDFGSASSLDEFLKKYDLNSKTANRLFYRAFFKIKGNKRLYEMFVKDLAIEKDKLINDVKVLKKLKYSLYRRVGILKSKIQADDNIEDLEILGTHIEDLGLSMRAFQGLSKLGVSTVQDIIEYPISIIANISGIGAATLKEIQKKLAEYNLRLSDDD